MAQVADHSGLAGNHCNFAATASTDTQQQPHDSETDTIRLTGASNQPKPKYPPFYFAARNFWQTQWKAQEVWILQNLSRPANPELLRIPREGSISLGLLCLDMCLEGTTPVRNNLQAIGFCNATNSNRLQMVHGSVDMMKFDHGFVQIPSPAGGYREELHAAKEVLELWATGSFGYMAFQEGVTEQFLGLILLIDSKSVRIMKMFELPAGEEPQPAVAPGRPRFSLETIN